MGKITIIGAGIAGISAGYHLKKAGVESIIFEKNDSWGGLCDNFQIDGFRFDKFIHLSFSNDEYVKNLFRESSEFKSHIPNPTNYYHGYWLKHPAQNNLFELEVDEKIKIIKNFIKREEKKIEDIQNYEEWLRVQYGNYFAKNFPMQYTEKYWTVPAKELEIKWIGNRMYKPTIEEVLEGAMTRETPNTYYAKEMRYPQKRGYKSFLDKMAENLEIKTNRKVVEINIEKKELVFEDGKIEGYEKLVSSIPLSEICKMIKNIPEDILEASKKLKWTSGVLISLGFNRPDVLKNLWMYIYDKEILTSRIYSPSLKSVANVPNRCSSLQGEIYFSNSNPLKIKNLDEILEKEIINYIKMGLFKKEDIVVKDIRIEKYANVIFDHEIYKNRRIIHDYLKKIKIIPIGRFGEWAYLWSDQSLLSGKRGAETICKENKI